MFDLVVRAPPGVGASGTPVPMGTRVPAGTHRKFENLGTAGYRVPGKFEKLGTAGYRVPSKFWKLGTAGYRVPSKFWKLGTEKILELWYSWVQLG